VFFLKRKKIQLVFFAKGNIFFLGTENNWREEWVVRLKKTQSRLSNRPGNFILLCLVLLLDVVGGVEGSLSAQDRWLFVRDSQGNEYYKDAQGKIHSEGRYRADLRPVSLENAPFYYAHAFALMKNPDRPSRQQGARILKEMLLLPATERAHIWRIKAARALAHFRQAWGDTFLNLEKEITFLRVEDTIGKEIFLHIPDAYVNVRYPADWDYIERREIHEPYTRVETVLVGKKFPEIEQMAISYDRFSVRHFTSLEKYRDIWWVRLENLQVTVKRNPLTTELLKGLHPALGYHISFFRPVSRQVLSHPMFPEERKLALARMRQNHIGGEEYFFYKKNIGYFISWSCNYKDYTSKKELFRGIINRMEVRP